MEEDDETALDPKDGRQHLEKMMKEEENEDESSTEDTSEDASDSARNTLYSHQK